MYKLEKTGREEQRFQNPSFSSTLLDKIYRSIDEGEERKDSDIKFYTETTMKKQSRINAKCDGALEKEQNQNHRRALKESEKVRTQRKAHRDYDLEQDVQFFSSTSSSSDSSSGLLSSSSDTESMYATKSRASCFAPSRPKPVRTSVVTERSEKTRIAMASDNEQGLIKSKSRAMKIYNNLKKVKQPISPGGKLTSFLNSLFTTKKTTTASSYEDVNVNVNAERRNASTCSSASSFSRSCLSKNSPSTREKLRNGVKRTVRFYPVSVIVDEDSQPCGHKAVPSVPTTWKIGSKKNVVEEQEVIDKSRRVEEAAREFLREYHRNNETLRRKIEEEEEDEDDDDASSCSSSDLFELDHLAVIGKDNRYCEELPVFETTRFSANRAVANGRIL